MNVRLASRGWKVHGVPHLPAEDEALQTDCDRWAIPSQWTETGDAISCKQCLAGAEPQLEAVGTDGWWARLVRAVLGSVS